MKQFGAWLVKSKNVNKLYIFVRITFGHVLEETVMLRIKKELTLDIDHEYLHA